MLYFVRFRRINDSNWTRLDESIHAITAARAAARIRKQMKLPKSCQVQALKDGFPTKGSKNNFKKSLTVG